MDGLAEDDREGEPGMTPTHEEPASTSSRITRPKPVLRPTARINPTAGASGSGLPKGARSNGPIWNFFKVDDTKDSTGAVCQVLRLDGHKCGKRLLQGDSGTSGLNKHLFGVHKPAFTQFEAMRLAAKAEKRKAAEELNDIYDNAEGLSTPSKRRRVESGVVETPTSRGRNTPRHRRDKHPIRSTQQLRWDLWMTEYFLRCGIPWTTMDMPGHKDFWARENPRYHLKHSTTFGRAKLPLLYDQVRNMINSKIAKDLPYTSGVAFTADHWTSRSNDPYLGVTMHTKSWLKYTTD